MWEYVSTIELQPETMVEFLNVSKGMPFEIIGSEDAGGLRPGAIRLRVRHGVEGWDGKELVAQVFVGSGASDDRGTPELRKAIVLKAKS